MSSCAGGVTFLKQPQFRFRNSKLPEAAIQTNHILGKHPTNGLISLFRPGEMDGNLSLVQVL